MAALVVIILAGRASLADQYVVPSGSMEPTVQIGDRILVSKLAYGLRVPLTHTYLTRTTPPARGDVVVLSSPEGGTVLLKRVVAVPGDRIQVAWGRLVINDRVVPVQVTAGQLVEGLGREPHPVALTHGGGPALGPVTVPSGRYLVLGDNRGESHDGRSFGWVAGDAILGRALGVFWRDGAPTWERL